MVYLAHGVSVQYTVQYRTWFQCTLFYTVQNMVSVYSFYTVQNMISVYPFYTVLSMVSVYSFYSVYNMVSVYQYSSLTLHTRTLSTVEVKRGRNPFILQYNTCTLLYCTRLQKIPVLQCSWSRCACTCCSCPTWPCSFLTLLFLPYLRCSW